MIKIKFLNEECYHDVTFARNNNIVTLYADAAVINAQNTSGFCTYKVTEEGDPILLGGFPKHTTVYRVTDNYIQYSSDGSVWKEPTKDVTISAHWDDQDDADGIRPAVITMTVQNIGDITLTAEDDWKATFSDIPISTPTNITAVEEVEEYTSMFWDNSVMYVHDVIDLSPSLEDRVTDIEDAVIELYDLIIMGEEEA